MSTFNIQNISAINLQTGDNNNMSIIRAIETWIQ